MGMSPCKDCEERHVGCHSKCEKYAEFRKEVNEKREALREQQKLEEFSVVSAIRRCKHRGITVKNVRF